MLRSLKRRQKPLAVLFAVLLPLVVYRSHAKELGDANVIDKFVLAVTGPLRSVMLGAVGLVSDTWDQYIDVVDARRENADLKRRVQTLEHGMDQFSELQADYDHLTELLAVDRLNPPADIVAARVIGAGNALSSRTIQLDRGALDGIKRGHPVIDGRGLVGVVQRVGWKQAEVVLIADEQVTVHALVVRTRARGRVRGLGLRQGFAVQLTEVLRSDDVAVGDLIITSGLGGVFPRGIPVGIVTGVREVKGAQHRVADLAPFVDFARLELVAVVVTEPRSESIATPEPLLPPSLRTPGLIETGTITKP